MKGETLQEYGYSMTVPLPSPFYSPSIWDMGVIRWRLGDGEWQEVEPQSD